MIDQGMVEEWLRDEDLSPNRIVDQADLKWHLEVVFPPTSMTMHIVCGGRTGDSIVAQRNLEVGDQHRDALESLGDAERSAFRLELTRDLAICGVQYALTWLDSNTLQSAVIARRVWAEELTRSSLFSAMLSVHDATVLAVLRLQQLSKVAK